MVPYDIFVSSPHSKHEVGGPEHSAPKFHEHDLGSVTLVKGMKFPSAALFKAAVNEANIVMGKDIHFKKNIDDKVVMVCRTKKYQHKVYGRKVPGEGSFDIRDIHLQHKCHRRYKLS